MNRPFASVETALERRLDHASAAPLVVALSGGGDSLALLHLSLDWAREAGRPVLALTVDHQLNPDSGRWTAEAGARARSLGAAWRALAWDGAKPATGLPAAARKARHALLAAAAREAGARVVLMGHTADDIAESEIMRAVDVPGLGRLREWTPSPVWPEGRGIFLLRPLLGVRREALRDYLRELGETWLDDPANDDLRFARVRARRVLTCNGCGQSVERGFGAGTSAAIEVAGIVFDSAVATAPRSLPSSALAALLLCVSGTDRPPRGAGLNRLQAMIAAGETATLCGCRIEARGDLIHVARATPRRGQLVRSTEPADWVAARFAAACGYIQNEIEAGAPIASAS